MGLSFCPYLHLLIFHNAQRKTAVLSCFQTPKTPLQKSMDRLGKQLTLFSFGIIGELNTMLTAVCGAGRAFCDPGLLLLKVLGGNF